ncbi:hypothetical protein Rfer_4485 (plasmid) [Rhodoferax ferrireducens T118]|uniref:Uncharacterized protein n=1 Tax=Albidiferax ferrireducens (strain ATCC BAA-621 / DSM 15236 / T118) TaxID=338969 RepID=Q21PX5_ALBFT|nr:hypothetical protein [Rhodoferax ferrireducens]ABD72170.1 hypothetical protein Rfer_4485 [Rhodoferax ferrireducens T118]
MQLAFASNHEINASTVGKMMPGNGNPARGRVRPRAVTSDRYGQWSPDMIDREKFHRNRHVSSLHGVQAEKARLLYEAYAYLHFKRFNTKPIDCIMQMVSADGMYRVPRQTVNEDGAEILLPIGLFGMPFEQAFCEFCNDMEALYAEGGKQRLAWAQKGMNCHRAEILEQAMRSFSPMAQFGERWHSLQNHGELALAA